MDLSAGAHLLTNRESAIALLVEFTLFKAVFYYYREVISMNGFQSILQDKGLTSYIVPLFWQHGEEEGVLREEIR